jgi:hypothetical protein
LQQVAQAIEKLNTTIEGGKRNLERFNREAAQSKTVLTQYQAQVGKPNGLFGVLIRWRRRCVLTARGQ